MTRFPAPLRPGDLIAITAPSSGVTGAALTRLDLALDHLRGLGFRVVEGSCLRHELKDASASRRARSDELSRFLLDPRVSAIFPPWGGELASELLDDLDFDALASATPKWLIGFSDISTLQLPLTLLAGWATAHGTNLLEFVPAQTDPLTTAVLTILASDLGAPVVQRSSARWQRAWQDYAVSPGAPYALTAPTEWKRLDGSKAPLRFAGHLVGGCIDTIMGLAGTRYGDVPGFVRRCGRHGAIVYLENAELPPPALVRALLSLRRHGWFDGIAGLVLGRDGAAPPTSESSLGPAEALAAVLSDLPCPVLYDVDIGHRPPQMTLINGAWAEVEFDDGTGSLSQRSLADR